MSILKKKRRRNRRRKKYTVLRCIPMGHQVQWCRGLCKPVDGRGMCGRQAPHAMGIRSQYQEAIEAYKAREKRDE